MSEPRLRGDVPLAPLTTLRIGGPARFFFEATSEGDLEQVLGHARERGLPVLVLGGGSNLLVADRGFDGVVVQIGIKGAARDEAADPGNDRVLLTAGAGEDWDPFVASTIEMGLAGLECLSGIPGRVGATPIQNVGAYGQEVAETIVRVRVFDRESQSFRELAPEACRFGYRSSVFKTTAVGRFVVTSVTFALRPNGAPCVRYPELARSLAATEITLGSVRQAVLGLRRSKSMVIDEADVESTSAGSFFLNPILDAAAAEALDARARAVGAVGAAERIPRFDAEGGRVKVPAAWLIERAGFQKGEAWGQAGISRHHSLALVNRGGATAREVIELAERIRARVAEVFGIALVIEPVLVGFES